MPIFCGRTQLTSGSDKNVEEGVGFFSVALLIKCFPPTLAPCPSPPHARSILVVNPSVATGAFGGRGSKPVAVLEAVAWIWDINSALGAAMKTSSTVVDHKLLLSHRYFLPSLCSCLQLPFGALQQQQR